MIVFKNKGIINPTLLNSFGVSVKETANPIGQFGTGLKYALAVLLRKGIKVQVLSGRDCIDVGTVSREIRGKVFNFVTFNDEVGSFTTDLGKDWELWEAYREIYSNCLDENGEVFISDDVVNENGYTQIVVYGDEFEDIYLNRGKYILDTENRKPLYSCNDVEIYDGMGSCIFYKGIKATNADDFKSEFTYNIIGYATLTENRRFEFPTAIKRQIAEAIILCEDVEIIKRILSLTDKNAYEYDLDFNHYLLSYAKTSHEFVTAVIELEYDGLLTNKSAKDRVEAERPLYEKLDVCTDRALTKRGVKKLIKIQSSLDRLFDGRLKVKVVNSLKGYGNVFFSYENNTFYIHLEYFLSLHNVDTTTKAFIKRAIVEFVKFNNDEIKVLVDALQPKYIAEKVKLKGGKND